MPLPALITGSQATILLTILSCGIRYCQNIVLYQYRYGNTQHARYVAFLYFFKPQLFSLDVPLIKIVDDRPLLNHDYMGTLRHTQSRTWKWTLVVCPLCYHFHSTCPSPPGRWGPSLWCQMRSQSQCWYSSAKCSPGDQDWSTAISVWGCTTSGHCIHISPPVPFLPHRWMNIHWG